MFAEEATLISKNIPSPDLTRLRPVLLFLLLFFVCLFGVFFFQIRAFSHMKVANFCGRRRRRFIWRAAVFFFSLQDFEKEGKKDAPAL